MRLLLDEWVPRRLKQALPGHDVSAVVEIGWSGKRNSDLLAQMIERGIQALITVDQNL